MIVVRYVILYEYRAHTLILVNIYSISCVLFSLMNIGAYILGMEEKRPNWDKIGANMNSIRTTTLIKDADLVVVRFGEKYRQWNAVR